MSHFPEKGDAERAASALDERAALVIGRTNRVTDVGELLIDPTTCEATGDGMAAYRVVYGDLFDMGETIIATRGLVDGFVLELFGGDDPRGVMVSLFLQATAFGCLMERARWEQRR